MSRFMSKKSPRTATSASLPSSNSSSAISPRGSPRDGEGSSRRDKPIGVVRVVVGKTRGFDVEKVPQQLFPLFLLLSQRLPSR